MFTDDLFSWLITETATILGDAPRVSVSAPANHVDIADAFDEATYPFVGVVPITIDPISGGLGNESMVPTEVYDDGGFDGVEKTLRREFSVEITPVTDNDPKQRDRLVDAIQLGYGTRIDADNYPDDITGLSLGSATPTTRSESLVRANGIELTGILHTRRDVDVPAVESVSWTVEVDGTTVPQTQ